jgi:imidazolonepropionase-like amidohydrolase
MVEVGMSPMEAIVSSTSLAAECLGWDDHLGSVEPGKLADLIIVNSDPLTDIHTLENVDNIKFVMKGGAIYKDHLAN